MTKHLSIKKFTRLPHAFMCNQGGVSSGIYESLNCGPGSGDSHENILENRCIVAEHIAKQRDTPVLSCYQHHSAEVAVVSHDWGDKRPKADAMVTNTPALILGILTADCTPVLLADEQASIIGAAHAGWKGAYSGVIENTVHEMEKLGASRNAIKAAIGPTIHQNSYEVDRNFKERFLMKDPDFCQFFVSGKDEDHFQFNLPSFVQSKLQASGIEQVFDTRIDTYKSDNHFSYRRTTHLGECDYGRQISVIMLPK